MTGEARQNISSGNMEHDVMELKALRCFVAVAEQLNFTRAAETLYISQPTLSIHIRELENELGAALFLRNHKQVFLTNQGVALLPAARHILESVDALPALVRDASVTPLPEVLRIGLDPTEDRTDIPTLQNILRTLSERAPAMKLDIRRVSHEKCAEELIDTTLDAAVIVLESGESLPPELLTLPLLRDKTILTAAHAEGMTLEEVLKTKDFLLFSTSAAPGRSPLESKYIDYLRTICPELRVRPVEDVASMLLDLRYGNTVSMLPSSYVDRLDSDLFTIFPTELPDLVLTLAWNKYNVNPAIEMMFHIAQAEDSRRRRGK